MRNPIKKTRRRRKPMSMSIYKACHTYVMPYGKYKGRLISEAVREDPRYFCWMLDEGICRGSGLRTAIQTCLDDHLHDLERQARHEAGLASGKIDIDAEYQKRKNLLGY